MKLRTSIFAGISLLLGVATAQADPIVLDLPGDNYMCPDNSIYISTSDVQGDGADSGSDACFGAYDGNDNNADGYQIGDQVFTQLAKANMVTEGGSDGEGGVYPADDVPSLSGTDIGLTVTFGDDCLTTTGADDNGCWSFNEGALTGDFLIVIKAANSPGWAAYLFSTNNDENSGTWLVAWGGGGGSGDDPTPCVNSTGFESAADCIAISHLSIYGTASTTVAEPGTLALFGLGLVGLGFARRRRITS
jgi:hypothetical protein